jgi:tRNA dimethylallyltransferase
LTASKAALVAVLGPTAVGKTALSIDIALRLDGEIVSADSRLVYRGMDIGTAKPSPEERAKVPHHLIDIVEPDQRFSLGAYRNAALAAIRDIQTRGKLPFLVGGTGQWVTAVLEGWQPPPAPADKSLRRELEAFADAHGHQALHERLAAVDPARARAIDARNVRRVVRALEIYLTTGVPPSRARLKQTPPFDALRVGLTRPRRELYERIDRRLEMMLDEGWLDEVERLLSSGLEPDAPSMSAIGYRQLARVVQGASTLDEARRHIRRASRQFVRRQTNWFKPDDPSIVWFAMQDGVVEAVESHIRAWLEGDSAPSDL